MNKNLANLRRTIDRLKSRRIDDHEIQGYCHHMKNLLELHIAESKENGYEDPNTSMGWFDRWNEE